MELCLGRHQYSYQTKNQFIFFGGELIHPVQDMDCEITLTVIVTGVTTAQFTNILRTITVLHSVQPHFTDKNRTVTNLIGKSHFYFVSVIAYLFLL